MGSTSRKKRPLDRTISSYRDARLIIIATEGELTEEQYFRIFRESLRESRVQVKVLPTEAGKSAPGHVLARLNDFRDTYDLDENDQLWVMVDVDCWPKKTLAAVARQSSQKTFSMAVSNPCFELWLYLHHADIAARTRMTSQQMKLALRALLGEYNSSNLDLDRFSGRVGDAVRRAALLDANPNDRWPNQMGTHVYKVIREIQCLLADKRPAETSVAKRKR